MELNVNKINTNITKTARPSNRKPPLRRTNLFLTISPNITLNHLAPEAKDEFIHKFEEACDDFYNRAIGEELVELKDSAEVTPKWQEIPLLKRVESAAIDYVIEVGEQKGILHSHASYFTSHRAVNMKLKYSEIYKWWENKLGMKVYFHSEIVRDSKMSLRDYMSKQSDQF